MNRLIAFVLSTALALAPASAGQMSLLGAGKAGASGCADSNVIAWKAAVVGAGGSVSGTQETRVCNLVNNLKGNGGPHSGTNLFTGYDRIWLLAAENTQQALIDVKNLGAATNSGATFTASQGYAGNASTTFVDTGFSSSLGVNYTQNSASIFVYVRTNRTTSANKFAVGSKDAASFGVYNRFGPYWSSNVIVYPINGTGANPFDQFASPAGTSQGAWTISRTGSTTTDIYRNSSSTSLNTSTNVSNGSVNLETLTFYICGSNGDGALEFPSDDQIAIVGFSAGQSGANAALAQTDFNTYMTALGTNVY